MSVDTLAVNHNPNEPLEETDMAELTQKTNVFIKSQHFCTEIH